MDAANMLKPLLARGELRMHRGDDADEYRKYIEKDAALERRFQPVHVAEPSVDDTIAILRGLKERYEVHHGVRSRRRARRRGDALATATSTERFLPDKAIDLRRRGGRRAAHRDRLDAAGARRGRPAS